MRKFFKWTLWIIGGMLGLVVVAIGAVYAWSEIRINRTFDVTASALRVPADSASLARGKHLVQTIAKCGDCHGDDLAGKVMLDEPAIGRLVASNITPGKGGVVSGYTDQDWVYAIRHGLRRDGKALLVMPAREYWHFDDAELGAIIHYIKSVPPVDKPSGESSVGPLARVLYLADQLGLIAAEKVSHDVPPPVAPTPGPTVQYGQHLAMTSGCVGCHGEGFSGGPVPGMPPAWPPASNLTPDEGSGMGSWTEQDFFAVMREGKRPNGAIINSEFMPWKATMNMSDDEIRALWLYLRTVPPKEVGNR